MRRLDEQTAKEEEGRGGGEGVLSSVDKSVLTNWRHFLHKMLHTLLGMAVFAPMRTDGHKSVQLTPFDNAVLLPTVCATEIQNLNFSALF